MLSLELLHQAASIRGLWPIERLSQIGEELLDSFHATLVSLDLTLPPMSDGILNQFLLPSPATA